MEGLVEDEVGVLPCEQSLRSFAAGDGLVEDAVGLLSMPESNPFAGQVLRSPVWVRISRFLDGGADDEMQWMLMARSTVENQKRMPKRAVKAYEKKME